MAGKHPVTPAVRVLRAAGCAWEPHLYEWEDHGGTSASAAALGVDEHLVVKTLVMETDAGQALVVLMHGDCEVSTKALARLIGCRSVAPVTPGRAQQLSGYLVGGTSPFGFKTRVPVYMEEGIASMEKVYINGGKRGFLVSMRGADIGALLGAIPVQVAQPC